jgi:hypothetical protein
MLTEWSALCSPEDPVLVVPWTDPLRDVSFVDLRRNPYDFDAIPEAVQHPALLQCLRALNAARSPVFTAKCDVWKMNEEELSALRLELDADITDARSGFASYVDVVCRDRGIFTSAAQQQQLISRLLRQAGALEYPAAAFECVLRPALVDLGTPQEGYAISIYLKAVGSNEEAAIETWGAALADIVRVVRSREFARFLP